MALTTPVTIGQTGHATLHTEERTLINALEAGAVRHDITQTLSAADQLRARTNIGALGLSGSIMEWDEAAGEYTNASIQAFFAARGDGLIYGVEIPKGMTVACTKTAANAGIASPIPGIIGTPAVDPYQDRGPFRYLTVNGYVTPDGMPHVTAIDGDANFSLAPTTGNVWIMTPVIYWRYEDTSPSSVTISITDSSRPGFTPQPKAKLPDGSLRPYMLFAKYALSIVDGTARSISGRRVANRTLSHNSMLTTCKNATTGYSGKSYADDWYAKIMFLLKYGTKNSQSVFTSCSDFTFQHAPAIAETGVTRVILASAQAANFPVGAAVMLGSNTPPSTDRGATQLYNVVESATILSKEAVGANVALNLDVPAPFDTTTTQLLSTAPWHTGACDSVVGDGSPTSNLSSREPYTLQGIEMMLGMTEILGDVILTSDGSTGWKMSTVLDSANASTAVTANYTQTGKTLPSGPTDAAWYPLYPDTADGLLFGTGVGGSTSTGLCDYVYTNANSATGARAWLSLGTLASGGNAGAWSVVGTAALSTSLWYIGSRLSGVGRAGV